MVAEVQTLNEFVTKEVFNAIYYISGLFTMVTSLCEYDEEEGQIIRKEGSPSKSLLSNAASVEESKATAPKGLFALSFEKIPCDQPIKPCQFRTGRRYIQPDNFPDDDGLDHYLGFMSRLSSKMEALKTNDSTLSFDFASEDHLEFQILSEQVVEYFPQLDENMLQALKSYFPHHMGYLSSQTLNPNIVQEYFTSPEGEEDILVLQEICFYLRALAEDAQNLSTKIPQVSPKDYEDFLDEIADTLPLPESVPMAKFEFREKTQSISLSDSIEFDCEGGI